MSQRRKTKMVLTKCKRCGYEWIPKVAVVILCASCRSPYWNVVKTRGVKKC